MTHDINNQNLSVYTILRLSLVRLSIRMSVKPLHSHTYETQIGKELVTGKGYKEQVLQI